MTHELTFTKRFESGEEADMFNTSHLNNEGVIQKIAIELRQARYVDPFEDICGEMDGLTFALIADRRHKDDWNNEGFETFEEIEAHIKKTRSESVMVSTHGYGGYLFFTPEQGKSWFNSRIWRQKAKQVLESISSDVRGYCQGEVYEFQHPSEEYWSQFVSSNPEKYIREAYPELSEYEIIWE